MPEKIASSEPRKTADEEFEEKGQHPFDPQGDASYQGEMEGDSWGYDPDAVDIDAPLPFALVEHRIRTVEDDEEARDCTFTNPSDEDLFVDPS